MLALGSASALLWEAWADWAARALGTRFLGAATPPATELLQATIELRAPAHLSGGTAAVVLLHPHSIVSETSNMLAHPFIKHKLRMRAD